VDPLDKFREIDALFAKARQLVTAVGYTFGGLFTYLQLQKYAFAEIVQSLHGQALIHIALILYYYAWILAQPLEVQMSRTVYIADPNRGKIPTPLILVLPILIIVGIVLFVVQENERHLSIAFTVFFIFDVTLWINIARLALKYERASAKIYEAEKFDSGLVQLRCYVRSYLNGNWQYYRFATLAFILILFDASVHVDALRQYVSMIVNNAIPDVPKEKVLDLMPGSLFLSYILVGEGWVWTMRLRTRRTLLIVDELRLQYNVLLQRHHNVLLQRHPEAAR
jgi:hypothetical protein